jgi:hypothetical protein
VEYREFSWEGQRPSQSHAELTAADIEVLSRLMLELREITLSRSSYLAATDFLKRFGFDTDSSTLVHPEQLAH